MEMIEFFIFTLVSVIGLLIACFAAYLLKVFKGSKFEKSWLLVYFSGLVFSFQQLIYLLGNKLFSGFSLLIGVSTLAAGLYFLKVEWEKALESF